MRTGSGSDEGPASQGRRRPSPDPGEVRQVQVHLSWGTIFKVSVAFIAGLALFKLWPFLLLVLLALLIGVTLQPAVAWLEAHRLKRRTAIAVVIAIVLAAFCLGLVILIPALIEQTETFSRNFPSLRDTILSWLPKEGVLRQALNHVLENSGWTEMGSSLSNVLSMGGAALEGIMRSLLVLVIAFYIMIDGGRVYQWFLVFFSNRLRTKIRDTADQISRVVVGYVTGQALTSLIVMIYTLVVLSVLRVPGALMLSLLAAVFDLVPVLGFFLYTIPAFLLGLTVSPNTALWVLGLYIVYQPIEGYLLVPMIYGQRMRLSALTVLLGLLGGGILAGIPGALAALPILASYSAIEEIWLTPILGKQVPAKHESLKNDEFGRKGRTRVRRPHGSGAASAAD